MNRNGRSNWLQYRLRTSVALTTLIAIVFAYLARQDSKRRQLISDVQTAGGSVEFDDSILTLFNSSRVRKVMLPYAKIRDVGTPRLKSFSHLEELSLTDVETIVNGLRTDFSELRMTDVTDEMLDGLSDGIARVSVPTGVGLPPVLTIEGP